MEKWKNDVAVLCIFFARPEQFEKCFEQVRKARPRVLLLWQDGPREGRPDDVENIMKCRKIAENIDWECEVHRNYHEKNMGCDPSTFYSHKWAFSIVDKCIVLEDDLVASESFFPFCKELLDKYENDQRIDRICGTVLPGQYDVPNDYLFATFGNSWGWATWKRVADRWEEEYQFMDDEYAIKCMRGLQKDLEPHLGWEQRCLKYKAMGVPYWEFIIGAETLLNGGYIVYPRVNMISNVGISDNSTHAPGQLSELPKKVQKYFNTKTYDLEFPLKHPKYIIADTAYYDACRLFNVGTKKEQLQMFVERVMLKIKKILKRGK